MSQMRKPKVEEEIPVRIQFTTVCVRCRNAHAKRHACPWCADTLELDTEWAEEYTDQTIWEEMYEDDDE